ACVRNGVDRDSFEQIERLSLKDLRPLLPAMVLVIPLGRLAGVTAFDSRIGEQTVVADKLGEKLFRPRRDLGLRDAMRRHRECKPCDFDVPRNILLSHARRAACGLQHIRTSAPSCTSRVCGPIARYTNWMYQRSYSILCVESGYIFTHTD